MKRLFILLMALIAINVAFSQTPNQFKYQTVLRDSIGNIMASQAKSVVVNILQGSATGTSVFTETHNVTTTSQGIINLNIGSVNTTGIAAINWATNNYFIRISVDRTIMGTSQLLSVPYALTAKTVENVDYSKITGKPTISSTETKLIAGTNVTITGVGSTESPYVINASSAINTSGAIRALAQDYLVYDEQLDTASTEPLNTPTILRLDGGRLVAASERGGTVWRATNPWTRICTSDDGGLTWTTRSTPNMNQARLFKAGNSIYYLGYSGDLRITKSDDNGETWTPLASLDTKKSSWYAAATNVWHAKGNVYLVMERRPYSDNVSGWTVSNIAPILMRAKESDDLTKPSSWTLASELVFADIIPGFRANNLEMEYFGVPFFPQNFPDRYEVSPGKNMHPMGWLEFNVVQITDPTHQWYDPKQSTFHLFGRAHTGGTGFAAIAKVVENADGTMTTSLVQAPSGKKMLYVPLPGGQMKFHVIYDNQTKLYWLVSSQATNSMIRPEAMSKEVSLLPNNERQRLVLHFSKNMVDWCFAGVVAISTGDFTSRDYERSSFNYASMDFDGDDLVILARSGDKLAQSAHNGNLITFHRVKNFRSLVY